MSSDRVWYMHRNGMKEGPFTLEEMLGRKRDGILKPDSHVWRNGMAGWVAASSVEEFKGGRLAEGRYRVGSPPATQDDGVTREFEKSLVMELRRGVEEVEDQTTAIDRSVLRKAKSEAAQAARLERKHGSSDVPRVRGALLGNRSRGLGWKTYVAVAPMLALAVGMVGLRMNWIPASAFGPEAQPYLERWFSAVPALPGVSDEELRALRAAVSTDRSRVGIGVAFVREDQGYAMVVASNMPDGTVLRVGLRGVETDSEVTFPLAIHRGLAKSRVLQDAKGRMLQAGSYWVFVADAEDSDQSPAAQARLRALAPESRQGGTERLPAGMPHEHRFMWTEQKTIR